MAKRKSLTKKTRFEVFKRDSFRCQYCGRSAPEAILEVDHIKPVNDGGDNSLLNLITSCRDCNRGKSKTLLGDFSELEKQKAALDDLNERRLQLEMMAQWRELLQEEENRELDMISSLFRQKANCDLTQGGRMRIAKAIREFGFAEVYEATEIAIYQYCQSDNEYYLQKEAALAVSKIGGICANRKRGKFNGY